MAGLGFQFAHARLWYFSNSPNKKWLHWYVLSARMESDSMRNIDNDKKIRIETFLSSLLLVFLAYLHQNSPDLFIDRITELISVNLFKSSSNLICCWLLFSVCFQGTRAAMSSSCPTFFIYDQPIATKDFSMVSIIWRVPAFSLTYCTFYGNSKLCLALLFYEHYIVFKSLVILGGVGGLVKCFNIYQ